MKTTLVVLFEDNERDGFEQILKRVEGHTLVLELIAKQIANSHITISSAASLTDEHGFSAIAPEKVDYEKDSKQTSDTIGNIIDALFGANMLSAEKKVLMKVLSLLGDDGININYFQQIMQLVSKDDLNELIKDGWLTISSDTISMHNVIQEAVHRWEWTPEYVNGCRAVLDILLCGNPFGIHKKQLSQETAKIYNCRRCRTATGAEREMDIPEVDCLS